MKLIGLSCLLFASAWARNVSPLEQAPVKFAKKMNPMQGSESTRRAGAKLYAHECASCHGSEGQGGEKAPPLKRAEVYQAAPGTLFWVLENGSLHRGMPSFAHLPEPQRWQIISYLQSQNPAEHATGK